MIEQQSSVYENKIKKMIIEQVNMKNYDAILLLENHVSRIRPLLNHQGIQTVAVYGMGYVGQKVVELLEMAQIKVCYGIDKNSSAVVGDIRVMNPENISNDMQMIVITPELYYKDIYATLKKQVNVPIVRLSELLDELQLYV